MLSLALDLITSWPSGNAGPVNPVWTNPLGTITGLSSGATLQIDLAPRVTPAGATFRLVAPVPGATISGTILTLNAGFLAAGTVIAGTVRATQGGTADSAFTCTVEMPAAPALAGATAIAKWELDAPNALWQDAAQTIPAVADGDPVGLLRDSGGQNRHITMDAANRPTLRIDADGLRYLDFTTARQLHALPGNMASAGTGHLLCFAMENLPGGGAQTRFLDFNSARRFSQQLDVISGSARVRATVDVGVARILHSNWCPSGPSLLASKLRLNGGDPPVSSTIEGALSGTASAEWRFFRGLTGRFYGGWVAFGNFTEAESRALEAYWAAKARVPRAYMRIEGKAQTVDEDTDGLWPFRVGGNLLGVVCVNSSVSKKEVFWLEKPASIGLPWTRWLIGTTLGTPEGVCAVDIDGDGYPEVFATGQTDDSIWCFKMNTTDPRGAWTGAQISTGNSDTQNVVPFDFNGDGQMDLVFSAEENVGAGGGIYGLRFLGGNPLLPGSWAKHTLYAQKGTWHIDPTFPDLKGDGVRRIVFTDREAPWGIGYLEPGADPLLPWTPVILDTSQQWNFCAAGDVFNDGQIHIIGTHHEGGAGDFAVFKNDGSGNFTKIVIRTGAGGYSCGIFHFDGQPVVWQHGTNSRQDFYAWDGARFRLIQKDYNVVKTQDHPVVEDFFGAGPVMGVVSAGVPANFHLFTPYILGQRATTGKLG